MPIDMPASAMPAGTTITKRRAKRAASWLGDALDAAGLDVEMGVCGLPTAFVARAGNGPLHVAFCAEYGKKAKEISPSALDRLLTYGWPGNVRELKNVIERLVIMVAGDVIEADDLPVAVSPTDDEEFETFHDYPSLSSAREAFETQFIVRKLQVNRGNVSKTAEALGIERSHLYRKMKAFGIK